MDQIKSLADQLRQKMAAPDLPVARGKSPRPNHRKSPTEKHDDPHPPVADILQEIHQYDNTSHKNLVHVRFDAKTALLLGHFKLATGVEITKLVAFSVNHLFRHHPELKSIIKQFIKNIEL